MRTSILSRIIVGAVGCKERWMSFHPENWHNADVSEWLEYVCNQQTVPADDIDVVKEAFINTDGRSLVALTMEEFQQRTIKYGGMLHTVFKQMCSNGIFIVYSPF